jgi:hypothetical protein
MSAFGGKADIVQISTNLDCKAKKASNGAGESYFAVSLPPPPCFRNPFSSRVRPRSRRPELLQQKSKLCTPTANWLARIFSLIPIFSEALYFPPKVQFFKSRQIEHF